MELSPNADRRAVMVSKFAAQGDTERTREHGVIADFGVAIEREVRAVESNVVPYESGDAPVSRSHDGLQAAPKQTVMDQQQINALHRRELDRCFTQIDCSADAAHFSRVLDLESIQCLRIVGDVPNVEILIQIGRQISETHATLYT